MVALPLKLADGSQFYLTPGKHNELQIDIVEKFGPRYARNALVLYLGDAANKFVVYEKEELGQLGVPITNHDKLPDVILYREDKNWLYLIEANVESQIARIAGSSINLELPAIRAIYESLMAQKIANPIVYSTDYIINYQPANR
jgi:BsuBI/PstI restriction endonuclease domain